MTMYDRLKTDNKRILDDDMQDLTLFNKAGASLVKKGRVTQTGIGIDPQGQPYVTKKYTVAFHVADFASLNVANESYKQWQGQFLNSEGDLIKGFFNNTMVDKTFGYVSTTLTETKQ